MIYVWCNFSVDIIVCVVFVLFDVMLVIVDGVVLLDIYFVRVMGG